MPTEHVRLYRCSGAAAPSTSGIVLLLRSAFHRSIGLLIVARGAVATPGVEGAARATHDRIEIRRLGIGGRIEEAAVCRGPEAARRDWRDAGLARHSKSSGASPGTLLCLLPTLGIVAQRLADSVIRAPGSKVAEQRFTPRRTGSGKEISEASVCPVIMSHESERGDFASLYSIFERVRVGGRAECEQVVEFLRATGLPAAGRLSWDRIVASSKVAQANVTDTKDSAPRKVFQRGTLFYALPTVREAIARAPQATAIDIVAGLIVAAIDSDSSCALDDVSKRARDIHAAIDKIRASAAAAHAAVAELPSRDAAIDDATEREHLQRQLEGAETAKVAALEAEAVRADALLEQLQHALGEAAGALAAATAAGAPIQPLIDCALALCDVFERLSLLPAEPVEPQLFEVRPGRPGALGCLVAPLGASAALAELRVLADNVSSATRQLCVEVVLRDSVPPMSPEARVAVANAARMGMVVDAELAVPRVSGGLLDERGEPVASRAAAPLPVRMSCSDLGVRVSVELPDTVLAPGTEVRILGVHLGGVPLPLVSAPAPLRLPMSTSPRASLSLRRVVSGVTAPSISATGAIFVGAEAFSADGSPYSFMGHLLRAKGRVEVTATASFYHPSAHVVVLAILVRHYWVDLSGNMRAFMRPRAARRHLTVARRRSSQ